MIRNNIDLNCAVFAFNVLERMNLNCAQTKLLHFFITAPLFVSDYIKPYLQNQAKH